MSEVRVLRLRTGEDIISQVRKAKSTNTLDTNPEDATKLYLKEPQVMLMQPTGQPGQLGFAFLPFFPFTKETEIGISIDQITINQEPKAELLNLYNTQYGSGLTIATSLPPGDGRGGVSGARILG